MNTITHKTIAQNTFVSSIPFTGKERDRETGFSYFGARYYDCDLTGLFLSVDPMSDKYPSLSPYDYCVWNPIKLTDPNGMDTIFSFATRLIDDEQNKINLDILIWLREEGDTPGIVTLGMHGSSQKVAIPSCEGLVEQFYSASDFGRMIKNSNLPDYINNCESNRPTIFLLYCCSTGQGDNSFAEQLSWEIGGITIAPQGKLYVKNKGHSIRNSTDNTDNKGQPWNVYYRGRKVLSFDDVLPKEWINKMGGIEKTTDIIIEKDAKAHPWE